MANTIRLKRSSVAGKVPAIADLQLGEIAVNTTDGKLYLKKSDGAEAVAEHKSHLGPSHSVYFLQKYVEKGGYDVRVTLVNGEPVTAIMRKSDHWITNTARGGVPEGISVTAEMASFLRRTYEAVGGDILAVDLFLGPDGWLVNEINGQPEFRSSITTTGVDLPGLILKHAQSSLEAQR